MTPLDLSDVADISLKVANLKCFRESEGFDQILPLNVIIGKNNTGKSTLIDLIQYAVMGKMPSVAAQEKSIISASCIIKQEWMNRYTEHTSTNNWQWKQFAEEHLEGKLFEWPLLEPFSQSPRWLELNRSRLDKVKDMQITTQLLQRVGDYIGNPFSRFKFSRLLAERDIASETVGVPGSVLETLMPNGGNATVLITRYLNEVKRDLSLIEGKLLEELNLIFRPDAVFRRIVTRQWDHGGWEIHLEESGKGLIPLSRAGSGIKTILLVLLHLYVVPDIETELGQPPHPLSKYFFGFEELENNLHPALQRRLFLYLRDIALKERC